MASSDQVQSKRIERFGFNTVFRYPCTEELKVAQPEAEVEDLPAQIAALEARLATMEAEHAAMMDQAKAEAFEAGLAQARAEQAEALLAAVDALHAGLDDVESRFDGVMGRLLQEAGDMALQAAEILAGHVIATQPVQAVEEALSRALEQVARNTSLTVRVHPDIKAALEARIQARAQREGRHLDVMLLDDPSLPINDARISWAEGGLNVDSGARRQAVLAELADVLGREPHL